MIHTKRWNDPRAREDGYRLLVCRYRPRGVKKEEEPWDAWCPALGPSTELHAAVYGKSGPPIAWEEYERRYVAEMAHQRFWIDGFAKRLRAGETVTLLCSSACTNPARCHRTILKRLLEDAVSPAASANRPPVVRRRQS